jgi:hypothetical protein
MDALGGAGAGRADAAGVTDAAGAGGCGATKPGVIVISGWSVMASPIVRSVASLVASSIASGVASPSWSLAPGELPS